MEGPMVMAESRLNMKKLTSPAVIPAVPIIGIAEAPRLLDLALQNETLGTQGDVSPDAKHRALNELTGSSIMLPTRKP